MKSLLRKIIAVQTALLASSPSFAQLTSTTESFNNTGAEFFVGRELGRPLVTVNLLSGVARPGVYHVPTKTSLPQLIAYAGGTVTNADINDITIRRLEMQKTQVLTYNLNDVIGGKNELPQIEDRDLVHIKQQPSLDTTLRWVALIAGMASIVFSVSSTNQILHHP